MDIIIEHGVHGILLSTGISMNILENGQHIVFQGAPWTTSMCS